MSLVPRSSWALKRRLPMIGCCSVVFDPTMRMQSASSKSGIELVIAPLPNDAARPATVEECQRRAQWSTLLVPSTVRASFCKR
jgi:hypothetical protein